MTQRLHNFWIVVCCLLTVTPVFALEWQDDAEVAHIFEQAEVEGAFVVYDVAEDRLIGFNRKRANTPFVPASTFKIPNSLIGLATGAVESVDEVLPYGGEPQPIKAWEQDMALREAIKISNVPIYQELARRIGLERMQTEIEQLGYGNARLGHSVDEFWLVGPLEITPVEQTLFLARLAQGHLPLPQEVQSTVRDIVELEQGEGWTLYGKTGWTGPDLGIGWWVGWIERENAIFAFAVNMELMQIEEAPKRIELGKAALRALGLLPE